MQTPKCTMYIYTNVLDILYNDFTIICMTYVICFIVLPPTYPLE